MNFFFPALSIGITSKGVPCLVLPLKLDPTKQIGGSKPLIKDSMSISGIDKLGISFPLVEPYPWTLFL